jgi:aminopeptidase YwaD
VGMSALVSALVLTSADAAAAGAVVAELESAALTRLRAESALGVAAIAGGGAVAHEVDILDTWAAWYRDALATVSDIEVGGTSPRTREAISRSVARVEAARQAAVTGLTPR